MKPFASPEFWEGYSKLPDPVRKLADKNFDLLKNDPRYPFLRFKKVGHPFSARVGLSHRVLGVEVEDGVLWIGSRADYDKIVG